jgi:hypothetical protein
MTHEQKAKDLVNKFLEYSDAADEHGFAKKCASLAVDEIMHALIYPPNPNENRQVVHINTLNWWKQVKKEIQKL